MIKRIAVGELKDIWMNLKQFKSLSKNFQSNYCRKLKQCNKTYSQMEHLANTTLKFIRTEKTVI